MEANIREFSSLSIHLTQILGAPLYYYKREWYDRYMSKTKEFFGLTIIAMTQWWGPTTIRISGDAEVTKEISKTLDGLAECNFPERMVMIANHQVFRPFFPHCPFSLV